MNLLGLHVASGSRNGYGMVAPLTPGVLSFEDGAFDETNPARAFLVLRHCEFWGGECDIMPGFNELTLEDMPDQAAYYWPLIRSMLESAEQRLGRPVDAVQLTNETGGNDRMELAKVFEFEYHVGLLAAADNRRVLFGNQGTDSPSWELWTEIVVPHIYRMWPLGHIYDRHVYATRIDEADYLVVDLDGQTVAAGGGPLRLQMELDYLLLDPRGMGPVIVGEVGFVRFPGVTHFMSQITQYNDLMSRFYPYLGFMAIFTEGVWGNANIQDANPQLAQWMASQPPVSKWEPPAFNGEVDPPPSDNEQRFAVQPAFAIEQDERRVYYAPVTNYNDVRYLTQGQEMTDWEREIFDAGLALDTVSPNFDAALQRVMGYQGYFPTGQEGRVTVAIGDDEPGPITAVYRPCRQTRVTQAFGVNPQNYPMWGECGHEGIDIGVPLGDPVFAVQSGQVVHASNLTWDGLGSSNYGWHVVINHGDYASVYGHLSPDLRVNVGDYIPPGRVLGVSGNTGVSTGAHLHFSILTDTRTCYPPRLYGYYTDPTFILNLPQPPEEGDAQTVDVTDYFRPLPGKSPRYVFQLRRADGGSAGSQDMQVITEGAKILQLKGSEVAAEYEELWVDGGYVWRGADTSPGEGRLYIQRQTNTATSVRAVWCPSTMTVGRLFERRPYVWWYNKADCRLLTAPEHSSVTYIRLAEVIPVWSPPENTSIVFRDVIRLEWYPTLGGGVLEEYWYAKEIGGLVAWRHADGRYHYINELPEGRRDMVKESTCLS